jgi:hypothetical protein
VKKLIPLVVLLQISTSHASLISIMDSGTDMSHPALAPKQWINNEPGADGLPGDTYGYDFTTNTPKPFDPKYEYLMTNQVQTFFKLYAEYDLQTINATDLQWLKTNSSDPIILNTVNFIGEYIHGTHVAGISSINNPNAKLFPLKIIPTVYIPYTPAAKTVEVGSTSNVLAKKLKQPKNPSNVPSPIAKVPGAAIENPAPATILEYQNKLIVQADQQIDQMVEMHKVLNFHNVDVVNQSFGIGWGDANKFITKGFVDAFKRQPTVDELSGLMNAYFAELLKNGNQMFEAAPNTIFCIAAGNDSSNNDAHPDYPSSIKAPNRIVVAATLGYSSLANFSNYGAKNVDIAAPGVGILSTTPAGTYIPLSGTSQATPFITNIVALIKDTNSNLNVSQIIQILYGTVDVKSWLQGKVATSGIANKSRAIKAAQLSLTMNVESAITQANTMVADVGITKSFNQHLPKIDILYHPTRPSLLIVK